MFRCALTACNIDMMMMMMMIFIQLVKELQNGIYQKSKVGVESTRKLSPVFLSAVFADKL